jgi:hypothetical protein
VAELERDDALLDAARTVARTVVGRGTGRRPFIITTTPQAEHLALSFRGARAALGLGIVPLAIAIWLVWARFG